jgi:cytochrome c-type biogenesis protein CcmH/NrfF
VLWAAPLAALYAIGLGIARLRRRAIPEKPQPASYSDSRYRR